MVTGSAMDAHTSSSDSPTWGRVCVRGKGGCQSSEPPSGRLQREDSRVLRTAYTQTASRGGAGGAGGRTPGTPRPRPRPRRCHHRRRCRCPPHAPPAAAAGARLPSHPAQHRRGAGKRRSRGRWLTPRWRRRRRSGAPRGGALPPAPPPPPPRRARARACRHCRHTCAARGRGHAVDGPPPPCTLPPQRCATRACAIAPAARAPTLWPQRSTRGAGGAHGTGWAHASTHPLATWPEAASRALNASLDHCEENALPWSRQLLSKWILFLTASAA